MGTSSFISSFIKDALPKDVHHMNFFPKMGDVWITFEILTHYFMQQPSNFLNAHLSPSFS
jgi:hypothetical protein